MIKHLIICDYCNNKAKLKYNGEHWLPPEGWFDLWCPNLAQEAKQHVCPKCAPKKPKENKINEQKR